MISREQFASAQQQAREYLSRAGIVITPEEAANIEVADFGLNELHDTGLELVVYVNTERVCAKELVLFPRQTCPQHYHPPVEGEPGKEETFRCRWGEVYLYVPGEALPTPRPGRPRDASIPTMSGMRSSCARASNTRCRRIRRTGSRPETKARSCLNSPPAAATKSDIFTDPRSSEPRRSQTKKYAPQRRRVHRDFRILSDLRVSVVRY